MVPASCALAWWLGGVCWGRRESRCSQPGAPGHSDSLSCACPETRSSGPGHPKQNPHSPTLEDTALFMMSSASLNLSLMDGCASTWSENMDFQPRYHLVISS